MCMGIYIIFFLETLMIRQSALVSWQRSKCTEIRINLKGVFQIMIKQYKIYVPLCNNRCIQRIIHIILKQISNCIYIYTHSSCITETPAALWPETDWCWKEHVFVMAPTTVILYAYWSHQGDGRLVFCIAWGFHVFISSYFLAHCLNRLMAQMTINIKSKKNFCSKNLWTACYIGIT